MFTTHLSPNCELKNAERQGLEPWRRLPVDRLAICSVTTPAPLQFCYELIALNCGCKCRPSFEILQTIWSLFSKVFSNLLKMNPMRSIILFEKPYNSPLEHTIITFLSSKSVTKNKYISPP